MKAWRDGEPLYAVINSEGFITCSNDDGTTRHHVAVWTDKDAAERAALGYRMRHPMSQGHDPYRIVRVTITEVL